MAEDVMDVVNDFINENKLVDVEIPIEVDAVVLEDNPVSENNENSRVNSTRFEVGSTRPHKKMKVVDIFDKNLFDLLGKMHTNTNSRMYSTAHRIGYQTDLGKVWKEIWAMLDDFPGSEMDETFHVSDMLIQNPQKLEFLIGLPIHPRPAYVDRLLFGKSLYVF